MTLGNLVALTQSNVKRMLAYSSIAHTGYILRRAGGLCRRPHRGPRGRPYYAAAYTFMNLGAFAVVAALQRRPGVTSHLDTFAGLGRREPVLGALMTLFLLSLTGIPPCAGFFAKAYVILAAVEAGGTLTILAVIAVLNAAMAAFYYLRVVVYMYMREPRHRAAPPATDRLRVGRALDRNACSRSCIGLFPGPAPRRREPARRRRLPYDWHTGVAPRSRPQPGQAAADGGLRSAHAQGPDARRSSNAPSSDDLASAPSGRLFDPSRTAARSTFEKRSACAARHHGGAWLGRPGHGPRRAWAARTRHWVAARASRGASLRRASLTAPESPPAPVPTRSAGGAGGPAQRSHRVATEPGPPAGSSRVCASSSTKPCPARICGSTTWRCRPTCQGLLRGRRQPVPVVPPARDVRPAVRAERRPVP